MKPKKPAPKQKPHREKIYDVRAYTGYGAPGKGKRHLLCELAKLKKKSMTDFLLDPIRLEYPHLDI